MQRHYILAITADIRVCYITPRFLKTSLFFTNGDVSRFTSLHSFLEQFLYIFNCIQFLALAWQLLNVYIVVHKQFFTDWAECLGSLFFLKVILRARLRVSADCFKFCCSYWSCSLMPLIFARILGALAEKQPKNIKLPPPWFTVGTLFLGLEASLYSVKQKQRPCGQEINSFVSCHHGTEGKNFTSLSNCL